MSKWPKPECDCGATEALRYRHHGYGRVPPEVTCEACFHGGDTGPCFDDLDPVDEPAAPDPLASLTRYVMFGRRP